MGEDAGIALVYLAGELACLLSDPHGGVDVPGQHCRMMLPDLQAVIRQGLFHRRGQVRGCAVEPALDVAVWAVSSRSAKPSCD